MAANASRQTLRALQRGSYTDPTVSILRGRFIVKECHGGPRYRPRIARVRSQRPVTMGRVAGPRCPRRRLARGERGDPGAPGSVESRACTPCRPRPGRSDAVLELGPRQLGGHGSGLPYRFPRELLSHSSPSLRAWAHRLAAGYSNGRGGAVSLASTVRLRKNCSVLPEPRRSPTFANIHSLQFPETGLDLLSMRALN